MPLKQLSVFLENQPGRLHEVTSALGAAGINLRALSLADTGGFGVLRVLVSDLAKARRIAMEHQWPARVDEVVAVRIPDVPGSLARILGPLSERRMDLEYMYAFTGFSGADAVMIMRFKDNGQAVELLRGLGVNLLGAREFGLLESEEAGP